MWQYTCKLLYLLKVLKQRGHENWLGPMRIWEGVGIQYWSLFSFSMGYPETALISSLSGPFADGETLSTLCRSELGLGRPICRTTDTGLSLPSLVLKKRFSSSFFIFLFSSMELLEDSRSWSSCCLTGPKYSTRGGGSFWGGAKGMDDLVLNKWLFG